MPTQHAVIRLGSALAFGCSVAVSLIGMFLPGAARGVEPSSM